MATFATHDASNARFSTQDVTCVYASRCKHRIHYRVVDEYDGGTLSGKNTRTSIRPLALGELEAFFNGAWSIFHVLERNFGDDGYDVGEMLQFVIGVESQFYTQIGDLYRRRIEAWGAARQAELGLDEAETEGAGAEGLADRTNNGR